MTTLDELSARMDRMEATLDRVVTLLEARPPSTPIAAAVHKASAELDAVHGERSADELAQLLLLLGEPETLSSLGHLAALAPKLEYAAYFAAAGPELLEEAMEAANDQIRDRGLEPYEVSRRVEQAAQTLLHVTETDTMQLVRKLTGLVPGYMPLAEAASEALDQRAAHEGRDELRERMVESLIHLSDPETMESLIRIALLAPKLEYAAYFAAAGPELLEEGLEMARDKAVEHGLETNVIVNRLSQATDLLFLFTGTDQLDMLRQAATRAPHLLPILRASSDVLSQRAAIEGTDEIEARLAEVLLEITDPETMASLTRLVGLAPKLEYAAYFAAAGPELLDEITGGIRHWAEARGVEGVDQRLEAGLEALADLSTPVTLRGLGHATQILGTFAEHPETTQSLQRLVTRLPRLERTLGQVERALDVLDKAAVQSGIGAIEDLEEPAMTALRLLEVATRTETLDSLETVIELAPSLTPIAKPLLQAMASLDPAQLEEALSWATSPETFALLRTMHGKAPQLEQLLDTLELDPNHFRLLHAASAAASSATAERAQPMGVWSLLSATRDPDVQRSLGLAIALSRHLAANLRQDALMADNK